MATRARVPRGLAGLNRIDRRGCGVGRGGLRRIEAGKISRYLEQRIVAQELDLVVHRSIAARAGLNALQFIEQIGGALACEMRNGWRVR